MGRELQKRKRRSLRPKVTMPARRKKALNPLGNGIIAKNWNKKETLSQNYTRFGLVAKLGKAAAGGTARNSSRAAVTAAATTAGSRDPLAVRSADTGLLQVREVRVERDPATGRITRVLRAHNPLDDPLNELEDEEEQQQEEEEEGGGQRGRRREGEEEEEEEEEEEVEEEKEREKQKPEVLRALEHEASRPVEKAARHQSEREVEWLRRLVARHGQDTAAMARDRRLNPMQQTAADIARRLRTAGLSPAS